MTSSCPVLSEDRRNSDSGRHPGHESKSLLPAEIGRGRGDARLGGTSQLRAFATKQLKLRASGEIEAWGGDWGQ